MHRCIYQLIALFLIMSCVGCGLMELKEYAPNHSHNGTNYFEPSDKWGECFDDKPLRTSVGKYDYVVHSVFCLGKDSSKPPIVLLHESPGLIDVTLKYAEALSEQFTIYVPMFYGSFNQSKGFGTELFPFLNVPFNREWRPQDELAGSTRIVVWLRELVKVIEKRHKGVSIGVIGNCLTGSLPLALLDNKSIGAVVIAQPVLPFRVFSKRTGVEEGKLASDAEWDKIEKSTAKIYGVRFEHDRISPKVKFDKLKSPENHFIDRFIDAEISEAEYLDGQSPESHKKAHSTLISEYDTGGLVTKASQNRRDEVCSFLKDPTGFRRGNNKCSNSTPLSLF